MQMCSERFNIMRMKGRWQLNLMIARLIFMKQLKGREIIFWKIGMWVEYYEQKEPDKKPSARGNTYTPIYKYIWVCNGMYSRRVFGCR